MPGRPDRPSCKLAKWQGDLLVRLKSDVNGLSGVTVLVPQVEALGMIAVMRSLGAAGATVHAVSSSPDALGFHSRYANQKVLGPPGSHPEFSAWLKSYIHKHDIDVVMPTESLVLALLASLDQFAPWLPISLEPERLKLAFSKARLQELFNQHGISQNTPDHFVCTRNNVSEVASACTSFSFPLFVKVDAVDALPECSGNSFVRPVTDFAELKRTCERMLEDFSHVLVQSFATGKGAGVNCLRWNGELASLSNLCDHESPHIGGLSTLRRVWSNPSMEADAAHRLQALDWRGVGMLEYRVDPISGKFNFIELNARFWAALHLCLFAGADFPRFLVERHLGRAPTFPESWQPARACYDVPGEIAYVSSMLKDPAVSVVQKVLAVAGLPKPYLDPRIRLDLFYPGDHRPYVVNVLRFFGMSRWVARAEATSWVVRP